MRFDSTGKVSLGHIYSGLDPRPYFTALRSLDYCIPQQATPHFAKVIEEYRTVRRTATPQILDVGCSYGINSALLRCGASMEELYERYDSTGSPVDVLDRAELLAQDRKFVVERRPPAPRARFVGLDASLPALSYAVEAGYLDDAVHADLEANDPTPDQRARLAGTDLIISSGCIGYVTERTLVRVIAAQNGRRPWMAHFVLRMFPFDPMKRALAALGYRTRRVEGMFRQRRFASAEEQTQVLHTMSEAGVSTGGLEDEGWLHAQLYLSRPDDD
ncbi:class I SAM-dependent methyltransferase [Streptomyces sp. NRRL F-5126]|uniref:class I SAM-dependent methyltransferase n=1 Tax=Streptomyces sp. NRRL F-5126 TaxID=1463857 RepID=UPI0004CAD6E5|nr:class I SAM-dependent methyltransferase [Streptomyces sp. NRRL F-5126]